MVLGGNEDVREPRGRDRVGHSQSRADAGTVRPVHGRRTPLSYVYVAKTVNGGTWRVTPYSLMPVVRGGQGRSRGNRRGRFNRGPPQCEFPRERKGIDILGSVDCCGPRLQRQVVISNAPPKGLRRGRLEDNMRRVSSSPSIPYAEALEDPRVNPVRLPRQAKVSRLGCEKQLPWCRDFVVRSVG